MPGYVSIQSLDFQDLGGNRTRLVANVLFHTREERDGMLRSGMEEGMNESHAALERLLSAAPGQFDAAPP
jgi:uncharacterized protein YndB with AHSA1/START domain